MDNILEKLKELNVCVNYSHNDKGLGELFADIYKDKCRYNITTKSWYIYDGKSWTEDVGNVKITRYAKKLYDTLNQYFLTLGNNLAIKEYSSFIGKLGSLRNRKIMIEDAKDKYPISSEQLDTDAYLFNCLNGTYNLKTFTLQQHNPKDLISKISNVRYDKNARTVKFKKFIEEIMEEDTEKINYLQKILGYSLTGDTSEEQFYVLYGPSTRNGKTTLIEAYSNMLGGTNGYAISINPESFASKQYINSSQASGDIAKLKGYRFVNANEAPQNMVFNVNLLKKLTGRDTITARQIYQEEFDFKPNLKLFFNTNYLPIIGDNTIFTSKRVNVITFNRHFNEEEQNKNLKNELKEPKILSGMFNWCIKGLKKFNKEGAIPPEDVVNATRDYEMLNDKMANFIKERLLHTGKNEKVKDVYKVYRDWCENNGYSIDNKSIFMTKLKAKNIFSSHGTVNGKTYNNIVVGYEINKKEIN